MTSISSCKSTQKKHRGQFSKKMAASSKKMAASIVSFDDSSRDFHTNSPEIDAESERCTIFSGCSEDDQACAKMFWKSLTLHPPIESRLVSGDIRQRLPVAPPSVQTANYAYQPTEESPKLKEHIAKAHAQTIYEESVKLTQQAIARQETRHIMQKRKQERAQKDAIARRAMEPVFIDTDGDYPEDDIDEAAEALAELDRFDKRQELNAKK